MRGSHNEPVGCGCVVPAGHWRGCCFLPELEERVRNNVFLLIFIFIVDKPGHSNCFTRRRPPSYMIGLLATGF
jgi:hypothetical protein